MSQRGASEPAPFRGQLESWIFSNYFNGLSLHDDAWGHPIAAGCRKFNVRLATRLAQPAVAPAPMAGRADGRLRRSPRPARPGGEQRCSRSLARLVQRFMGENPAIDFRYASFISTLVWLSSESLFFARKFFNEWQMRSLEIFTSGDSFESFHEEKSGGVEFHMSSRTDARYNMPYSFSRWRRILRLMPSSLAVCS
jgi:hypothetical protein